jgi:hypothetical protein
MKKISNIKIISVIADNPNSPLDLVLFLIAIIIGF